MCFGIDYSNWNYYYCYIIDYYCCYIIDYYYSYSCFNSFDILDFTNFINAIIKLLFDIIS